MAYIGLAHLVTAPLEGYSNNKPVYKSGYVCGEGISTEITPNYNEGSLYGDNSQQEYIKEFKNANVKLGTTRLPIKTASDFFGHTVDESNNEIIYKTSDSSKYVGIGLYVDEIIHGVKKYTACWIYKVKFNEAAESYETKGDSIVFKTPSLEGLAIGIDSKEWKTTKTFELEAEAETWLNEMANITTETSTTVEDSKTIETDTTIETSTTTEDSKTIETDTTTETSTTAEDGIITETSNTTEEGTMTETETAAEGVTK